MSSTLVAVLVSIAIGLFMLISFFIGRKRGVRRTLLSFGISLVMFIAAFFLTPVITNLFMGITISIDGQQTPIGSALSTVLAKEGVGKYLTASASATTFVDAILPAIISVIVFFLVYLAFRLIGYIFYLIIAKIGFKSRAKEEELGIYRNKLGGGLLSVLKTFVFFVLLTLPLTSLTNFMQSNFFPNYTEKTAEASSELPSTEQISNEIPSELKKIISGYNKSIVGFSGHVFGVDNLAFDYLSKVEINGAPVYIRQTVETVLDAYNYVVDVQKGFNKNSTDFFKKLDYENFDKVTKGILESGMIKDFVLNVAADFVINYEEILPEDFISSNKEILEGLKATLENAEKPNELLLEDIESIVGIVKSAGKSGALDDTIKLYREEKQDEIIILLVDKYTESFVSDVIDGVFNVKLLRDNFEPIANRVLAGEGELLEILQKGTYDIQNWDKFVYDLKDIVTDVGNLYDNITNVGFEVEEIVDDPYLILKTDVTKVDNIFKLMGGVLDKVDNLEILKNKTNNDKLFKDIFETFGVGDLLEGIEVEDGKTVNYKYLFNKLSVCVKNLIEFDLYEEIKSNDISNVVCKIADKMAGETAVDGVKPSQLKLEEIFETIFELPKIKEHTIDAFAEDLKSFVDLKILDDENERAKELRYMTNILVVLSENKVGTEETSPTFLKYILTDGNGFDDLLNYIEVEKTKEIFEPVFKSKMTSKICETIFTEVSSTLSSVAGELIEINPTKDQLINENDELCDIFAQFIYIYKQGAINDIDSVDKVELGKLLDLMKVNAYRGEDRSESGVFRTAFDRIIEKAENDYSVDFKKVTGKTNIYDVEFEKVCLVVDKIEKADETFKTAIKALLSKEEVTQAKLETMLQSINGQNEIEVLSILQTAVESGVSIDASGITIDIGGEETKTVYDLIDEYDSYDTSITQLDLIQLGLKAIIKG